MKKLEDNANKAQKKRVERNQQNRHNEDYEKNRGKKVIIEEILVSSIFYHADCVDEFDRE